MDRETPPKNHSHESESDYEKRAEQIFSVMKSGGICLVRFDVGYALICTEQKAAQRIFELKQRPLERRCVILGTPEIFQEITTSRYKDQASQIDLPVALIDKINHESKYSKDIPPEAVVDDTIAVFVNLGKQADIIAKYAFDRNALVYGSSANQSGVGNHYRLQDVEKNIRSAVELEFDDGNVKYQDFWPDGHGMSSTIIDLIHHKIARKGLLFNELMGKARTLKLIT